MAAIRLQRRMKALREMLKGLIGSPDPEPAVGIFMGWEYDCATPT